MGRLKGVRVLYVFAMEIICFAFAGCFANTEAMALETR